MAVCSWFRFRLKRLKIFKLLKIAYQTSQKIIQMLPKDCRSCNRTSQTSQGPPSSKQSVSQAYRFAETSCPRGDSHFPAIGVTSHALGKSISHSPTGPRHGKTQTRQDKSFCDIIVFPEEGRYTGTVSLG